MALLPFLYQCIALGNPTIVATKQFVFLNNFLPNHLLFSYKLPDGSYHDFLDPMFPLILSMSLNEVFCLRGLGAGGSGP